MSADVIEVDNGAGKVFKFGKATGESRKAMISAVAQVSWKNVSELQLLCPEAYPEARDAYMRDIGSEQHKPGGKLWDAHSKGPTSFPLFVYALIKPQHPDVSFPDARELLARDPDGVSAAVAALVPGFFDMLAAHPETPPEQRQAFRAAAGKAREALGPSSSTTPPG
jgi:hypothetical protein